MSRYARCCWRCIPRAVAHGGDGWTRCTDQREAIRRWLADGVRLTKIRKLLTRQGVLIAYPTLYRFAVLELQFGRTASTIPILDGEPGQDYGQSRVMVRS